MSAPQYRLTYFNIRSRGELCRLVFVAAGVPYDDVIVSFSDWPAVKQTTPFGQLPVLEFDGGPKICQSLTIAGLLATRFGLHGDNELDRIRVEMILGCAYDVMIWVARIMTDMATPKQAIDPVQQKEFDDIKLPTYMTYFDQMLGDKTYFVAGKLTLADIAFANSVSWLILLKFKDPVANFPRLKALIQRFEALPTVAEYLRNRPTAII